MKFISSPIRFAVRATVAATIAAVLSCGGLAQADNVGWNGGNVANTPWIGPTNWMYSTGAATALTDDPFVYNGGANIVYIGASGGASGKVLLNTVTGTDNTLQSIRIGHSGSTDFTSVGGPNLRGNGVFTVNNTAANDPTPLNINYSSSVSGSGDFLVAGASGRTGTVTWNSTGTLKIGGALRVGQNGTGTFNQNAGTVIAGRDIAASSVFAAVANGGTGTYNLNEGTLEIGAALDSTGTPQEVRRNLRIGAGTGTGTFNLGDGTGAAGSAVLRTWDDIVVGYHSATDTTAVGTLNIRSDGRLEQNFAAVAKAAGIGGTDAPFTITSGTVNQTGGVVDTDGVLQFGKDPMSSKYLITGSAGSLNVRALDIGATGTLGYAFDASGVMKMTVEGSTNTAGDTAIGITLGAGATLNLTGLSAYASNSAVTLIDSLDPAVIPMGTFANYAQGQAVGMNSFGTQFYINYTGGTDNNDVVLQTTQPGGANADFDGDGDVDGADFLSWQVGFGTGTGAAHGQGDSNADGDVDADDLAAWTSQYGSHAITAATVAVPEPVGVVGMMLAIAAVHRVRRRA
jgi:hypothetical protein